MAEWKPMTKLEQARYIVHLRREELNRALAALYEMERRQNGDATTDGGSRA